jgi:DNA-binding Xre family transcriptional regulator
MKLRIKEVAKQKGVKVSELATMVGVSRRTMYNWVNGTITQQALVAITAALKCSIYELIEPMEGFTLVYDEAGNFKGLSK